MRFVLVTLLLLACAEPERVAIVPDSEGPGQLTSEIRRAPASVTRELTRMVAPSLGATPRIRRAIVYEREGEHAVALYEWSLLDACIASYRGPDREASAQCREDLGRGEVAGGGEYPTRADDPDFTRCTGWGIVRARVSASGLEREGDVRLPYLGCRFSRLHTLSARELDGDAELELELDLTTSTPDWRYDTMRDGSDIPRRIADAPRRTLLVLGEDLALQLVVVRSERLRLLNSSTYEPDTRARAVRFDLEQSEIELTTVRYVDDRGCHMDGNGWPRIENPPGDIDFDSCVAEGNCRCTGEREAATLRYDRSRDRWE